MMQMEENGGDEAPVDDKKTYGKALELSDKQPTRDGFTFKGWNTSADGTGTAYQPGENYEPDQDGGTVTLYAQWTVWQHTVHYDANGGDWRR